jgi:hypothetical protein
VIRSERRSDQQQRRLVHAINGATATTGVSASTTGTAGANVTLTSGKYGSRRA